MRAITIDDRTRFHLTEHDVFAEPASLCWPATIGGNFYFAFPSLMRTCLGLDTKTAKDEPVTLHRLYELDQEAVRFLAENDFLTGLLNEAVSHLYAVFGLNVHVRLELSVDPDHGANRELFARILTSLSPREALALLERFDNGWWLDASPRSNYLLTFALRYIKNAV